MKTVLSQQSQLHLYRRPRRLLNHPLALLGALAVLLLGALPFAAVTAQRGTNSADNQPVVSASASQVPDNEPKYAPGELLVKLKPAAAVPVVDGLAQGARRLEQLQLPASLRALNQRYQASKIEPVFNPKLSTPAALERLLARAAAGTRRVRNAEPLPRLDHIFKLTLAAQADIEQAARDYAADPQVEYAEPNRFAKASFNPNDEFFANNSLWGLLKIQAPQAWDKANGQGVIVAVVDSGVDYNHPDLKTNMWQNAAEAAGQAGVDDDGNGFVDDINGWDFAYGDNDPEDKLAHGTHVAGTIAAVGNNQAGVVGLAHKARILPVKGINNNNNQGAEADLGNAILYAVSQGAQVINNSWGGAGQSSTIANAVQLAHQANVVVVSAAGNSYADAMGFFPANLKRSLTVSAFQPNDTKASFSNFGHELDVAAPGVSIISTIPNAATADTILYDSFGHKYASFEGTSMAAPHVAGLAALLIQAHPNWTNEQIRQAIRQSAHDTGTVGFDTQAGYGRINAEQALLLANTALPTALLTTPRNYEQLKLTVPVYGYADAAGGAFTYSLEIGAGEFPTSFTVLTTGATAQTGGLLFNLDTGLLPDGLYQLRLVTIDATTGKRSEDHVIVTIDNVFLASVVDHQIFANGIYQLHGQVAGNSCSYTLEWASGCNATKYFKFITSGPNFGNDVNLIGLWNTANVPDGEITLRLTATCGNVTSVDQKCVVVDKLLAAGWPVKIEHTPAFKSPKVADLDGDGKNEIILGASVFNANGSIKAGWTNVPGAGRTNPAIFDLDGVVQTREVVAAVYDEDPNKPYPDTPVIYAYRHDKSVVWSFAVANPDAGCGGQNRSIPSSISAGDVDGDGKMEVVFTAFFTDCLDKDIHTWVYVLNAQTGALEQQFKVTGMSRSTVALADIDRNGATDLLIAARDWDRTQNPAPGIGLMTVVKHNGTPLPGWPQVIYDNNQTEGWQNIDPVAADVDGDCKYEILVGRYLWRGNGTLYGAWPESSLQRSTGAFAPLADGDGYLEVITGGANGVLYKVFEHNGAYKTFAVKTYENWYVQHGTLVNVPNPALFVFDLLPQGNIVVADVDGDGQPEVLRGAELGHQTANTGLRLYGLKPLVNNQSAPSFPRYVNTANPQGYADPIYSTAAVADVDKDGLTDLVVAAGGKIYLWNLGKPFKAGANYWPMFQRDLLNTGMAPITNWIPCPVVVDNPPPPPPN